MNPDTPWAVWAPTSTVPTIDIATAHIEFADGAVASLSASRVSQVPVRKLRAFGRNGYASADLHAGSLREARRADGAAITVEERAFPGADALNTEVGAFVSPPDEPSLATLESGLRFDRAGAPVRTTYREYLFRFEARNRRGRRWQVRWAGHAGPWVRAVRWVKRPRPKAR